MSNLCDQFLGTNGSLDIFPSTTEQILNSYSSDWIQGFGFWYKKIHGFAALAVCTLGSIVSIFNLWMMSKREMRKPVTIILRGLAVADLLNKMEYIPYVAFTKFWLDPIHGGSLTTYSWAIFVLAHSIISQV